MAKFGEPKATENQTSLGPDIVIVASPPATLVFSLTFEDYAAKRTESMLKFSWNSLVSLSGRLLPHRIQRTSEMPYGIQAGEGQEQGATMKYIFDLPFTSPPPQAASLVASLKKAIEVPFSNFTNEQSDGSEVEVTVLFPSTFPFSTF